MITALSLRRQLYTLNVSANLSYYMIHWCLQVVSLFKPSVTCMVKCLLSFTCWRHQHYLIQLPEHRREVHSSRSRHTHPPAVPLSCTSWYKSSTPQRMDPYVCVDKRESKTCLNIFFVSSEKFLAALTSWGMVMVWYQLHKNGVTFTLKNDFKFWSHAWKSPSSFTVLVHYQPRLQISNAMTPEK